MTTAFCRPVIWLLTFSLVLLAACGEDTRPEEQVKARIIAMEEAGEAGERLRFMRFVADGFQGQQDSMTRDDFQRLMFLQFSQQRRIYAQLLPIKVTLTGNNLADAEFQALLTGGGGLIPDDGALFSVSTQWVLEGGDWMLWRADWDAIGPAHY